MSFKREGDDPSQLNLLKKRRVADLLSNFIPDDEAALIKNGRYTCLVCSHRPVFDTVGVLMVHRKGKRHLEGMKWFYGKKNELQREVVKRRHQEYVDVESKRQEPSSSAPLLTQTRKITHHALLRTTPYSSRHKKASELPESPKCDQEYRNDHDSNITLPSNQEPAAVRKAQADTISATSTTVSSVVHQDLIEESRTEERGKLKGNKGSSTVECEPLSEQRRSELEHYLKLKSSGWLKDRSGKWVKDENVEFDSDEDEPVAFPCNDSSAKTGECQD